MPPPNAFGENDDAVLSATNAPATSPISSRNPENATAEMAVSDTLLAQPSASTWPANPPTATTTPAAAETPTPRPKMDPRPKATTARTPPTARAARAMARSGARLWLPLCPIPPHDQVDAADGPHDQADGQEQGVETREPVDEEPDAAPHQEAGEHGADHGPRPPIALPRVLSVAFSGHGQSQFYVEPSDRVKTSVLYFRR